MKLKLKGCQFDITEEIQAEFQRVLDTDTKGLPGSVPKMEMWDQCLHAGGNYFRGWRWLIGLMVSFTIFTASVQKILDTTLYDINSKIFFLSRLIFGGLS